MYSFLQGKYALITPALVQIDVHGVGYELLITLRTFEQIKDKEEGKLYTYLHVREDQMVLFGFVDEEEKECFKILLQVSGVGASTARMILSSLSPQDLQHIILTNEVKQLEKVKGIGKKTAERLVLELKDKITNLNIQSKQISIPISKQDQKYQDALMALMSLGIQKNIADQALKKVLQVENEEISIEMLIKKSLASL